jgi:hypothetical protein
MIMTAVGPLKSICCARCAQDDQRRLIGTDLTPVLELLGRRAFFFFDKLSHYSYMALECESS